MIRFAMNNYHEKTPGCVTSMMERLQWESLEDRRGKQRLNLLHKMNNTRVDVDINKYIKHNDSRTRGAHRFYQERKINVVYYNSFFIRTLRDWNGLPSYTTSITNTNDFMACLGANNIGHQTTSQ